MVYDMVVDRPYGTEARIKHMNTTCHVDRLRESSGMYPNDSKFESAPRFSAWGDPDIVGFTGPNVRGVLS